MKYVLTTLFCVFLLNVNFAQTELTTTRTERSQMGQMKQAKKSAAKTLLVSLERYREAVKISDKKSQSEIKEDMLAQMTEVVSTYKSLLQEAAPSTENKAQVAEAEAMISLQNSLLKKAKKSADAHETEKLMVKLLDTL